MTGSTTASLKPSRAPFSRRQSIALVFCCTLFGATAQVLIKLGANTLSRPSLIGMLGSAPVMTGLCLYGLSTVFLVVALRDGELSILYPIISLTYVWVTILSIVIFRESMNASKALGISIIVLGVAFLGKDDKK